MERRFGYHYFFHLLEGILSFPLLSLLILLIFILPLSSRRLMGPSISHRVVDVAFFFYGYGFIVSFFITLPSKDFFLSFWPFFITFPKKIGFFFLFLLFSLHPFTRVAASTSKRLKDQKPKIKKKIQLLE
jgi:hypothetical protein